MYRGWNQIAFESELEDQLTPAAVADLPLALARTPEGIRVFDAICPHRGANLAYGGRLDGEVVVCPWHGRRIKLGADGDGVFCVREYRTLEAGGLIFVLLSERNENGFASFMEGLRETHVFIPGFIIDARTAPELVIENAFDQTHFRYVHGTNNVPDLRLHPTRHGEMAVEGIFQIDSGNPWQQGEGAGDSVQTRFFARVFSPTLCVTDLGEEKNPYVVITAATPKPDGDCVIRVSIALAPDASGTLPSAEAIRALLRDSRTSFEQDLVVWENRARKAPNRLAAEDRLILKYHQFCRRFGEGGER
jgi:nitrite reductase/ring-hydroxylating ferredoxin subunit